MRDLSQINPQISTGLTKKSGRVAQRAAVGLWFGQQERQQWLHFITATRSLRKCLGRKNF
jgi:hypothetical protein